MQDTEKLRSLVSGMRQNRHAGYMHSVGPSVDANLRGYDTLAAVQDDADLLLEAARLMQATELAEISGDGALQYPFARIHAENLTALGLAAGDPEMVFLGKVNLLVTEILQTKDRSRVNQLMERADWLVNHPLRQENESLNSRIFQALDHVESLLPDPVDPQLAAIDAEVAEWVASRSIGRSQIDHVVEVIGDLGAELNFDSMQYLYDAVSGVIDPEDKTLGTLVDRFRMAYEYYAALRFVNRGRALQELASAAGPLADAEEADVRVILGAEGAALLHIGQAGRQAVINSPQWRAPLARAKELLDGEDARADYIDALIHEGEFLMRENDPREAFATLNQAYTLAMAEEYLPALVVASIDLASLYFLRDMHREAAALFLNLLQAHPLERQEERSDILAVALAEAELALMYRFAGDQATYETMLGRSTRALRELGLHSLANQAAER
ncbi:MAG: hypothetical protein Q4G50_02020 [Corynebacterium sp.]|uniref:hypothetical protein n=1 Tax=Corynebacterium sp. TaxID=1720 RepID=UPI0026DF3D57|nr:hypothetical protein [Corynebacterium sp.]MDO5668759.1 hypothetical protein [Corynebacterium sp.]